ncbi:MAG: DUF3488 and DUF4129 domain-containing transglutaminase family protein [Cyanobacteriota bacterium]|jgi:transglutaminase-like putative cysteine protease
MVATPSPKTWWGQFQAQLAALPPPKTEESWVFRVLVQALVIIGIIATDVAAQTQWSFWAVPLSLIGAFWSWRRRKARNVALKFALAIGMLGVLFVFLSNLVVNLQDSRIALAGLLVQLQVLHSFDLPRRKDLGYSMVIGVILLGVAGTVSQTLGFAPWLALFLAVGIPTLVLDYRSRLGLEPLDRRLAQTWGRKKSTPQETNPQTAPLFPARLGLILGLTLAMGLTLFALFPRFPSYQLQTFPVSGPEEMKNQEFDEQNRDIVNPGYVNEGKEGQGQGGGGSSPSRGKGSMDDTFYYGFSSRINQNLRGQLTPKLVLRVRSQAAGFWRALSFDHYTGQGWEITDNDDITQLRRSPWSYRFHLDPVATQMKTQQIIQTYTAVLDLPNVIPTLNVPRYLYFPTKEIGVDQNGSLRSPAGLAEGLTYTVISEVPYRDQTVLRQAPLEYPRRILRRYRQIPPAIEEKVRNKAIELLQKSPQPINTVYDASLYLTQALKQNYRIRTDIPYLEPGEDLVEAFLFRDGGGYPDHFSTVLTVMLRSLGIPARFTAGFGSGQFNPFTGYYLVHNTDAFGLTEVYFPYFGWFTFDPIPGHDLYPPSIEDNETFSVLKQLWDWVAGWLPSPVSGFLSLIWTNLLGAAGGFLTWLWRLVSGSLIGALVGLMGLCGLGFLGWLGWGQFGAWLTQRRLAKLHPLNRLYEKLLLALNGQGFAKSRAQTPREYINSLQEHFPLEQWEIMAEIVSAYEAWRYGAQEQNLPYLDKQYRDLERSWRRRLAQKRA